jgi:hypothetical protein
VRGNIDPIMFDEIAKKQDLDICDSHHVKGSSSRFPCRMK